VALPAVAASGGHGDGPGARGRPEGRAAPQLRADCARPPHGAGTRRAPPAIPENPAAPYSTPTKKNARLPAVTAPADRVCVLRRPRPSRARMSCHLSTCCGRSPMSTRRVWPSTPPASRLACMLCVCVCVRARSVVRGVCAQACMCACVHVCMRGRDGAVACVGWRGWGRERAEPRALE